MRYLILVVSLLFLACDTDPECPECPPPTPTEAPTAEPTEEPTPAGLFIPDNCSNPPETISSTSGFKCKGSDTRGGTIVCLLPHEFTWHPYVVESDGHLSSTRKFTSVYLVRRNGAFIDLDWSGYANPVYLPQGKVNRQHWRSASTKWDDVKNKVVRIEMVRGNRRTCLSF